ncbi:hypothetical protein AB8613_23985 [Vibrio sp. BS-M-Sm-2]|uniref:hypothetical protein n=1 Tax=Vibrio sp. BS-M-Sm-2 TaxID=3241167 RepID=UPI0035581A65
MEPLSLAVDAIPEKLMPEFLKQAKIINSFWYDMFLLCSTFGLRNIECREMKCAQIDFENKVLILTNTKSQKSRITKKVNQHVRKLWLTKGRCWLQRRITDPNAMLIVRLASSLDDLAILAEEFHVIEAYTQAKKSFFSREEKIYRESFHLNCDDTVRVIDFSGFPHIEQMLRRRYERYQSRFYLFPRDELQRPQHFQDGDKPLSRQSVYNVLQKMKIRLKDKLRGVRIGLHSCRKLAVQRVAYLMKDTFAASIWVGHGNGKGDLSVTQRYLDCSRRRCQEINLKLSKACRNDNYDKQPTFEAIHYI